MQGSLSDAEAAAGVRLPGVNDDRLREECGVFGVFGNEDAAALTALGLHALQHRGQEAAGIVTYDGKHFHSERRLGHLSAGSVQGRESRSRRGCEQHRDRRQGR